MSDNRSRRIEFHRMTAAEFARLSTSRQLMLLAIRRAQLSSRTAIAAHSKLRAHEPSSDDSPPS